MVTLFGKIQLISPSDKPLVPETKRKEKRGESSLVLTPPRSTRLQVSVELRPILYPCLSQSDSAYPMKILLILLPILREAHRLCTCRWMRYDRSEGMFLPQCAYKLAPPNFSSSQQQLQIRELTLRLHPLPHGRIQLHRFTRMNDIHDRRRSNALDVFEELPRVSSISVGRVDAFGRVV